MRIFIDKFFLRSNNLDYISQNIRDLTKNTPAKKIFNAINSYSSEAEIRYVGGFVRKILNKENVDDIDLATNLDPQQVSEALKINKIEYYETGLKYGTLTAVVEGHKFEITSLRKDISNDGRHAKVQFTKNWKEDASRRDFTINSIYSDSEGNLFDPFDGKKDLKEGSIKFIGDPGERIKEDYLRILRYLRFFLKYSNQSHSSEVLKKIRLNINGLSKLSKERLLDELKKFLKIEILEKLINDKSSLEIFLIIFPDLKNIDFLKKIDSNKKEIFKNADFIFLLSLMIIDETDNLDYFLFKYNISKKDQKRIKNIDNFFKEKINSKSFTIKNMNKIFYYHGKQSVIDILNYRIIKSNKFENILMELIESYKSKEMPIMPIGADILMKKYKIPQGKQLGSKLKIIEEEWVNNNFKISDQQVDNIINN